VKDLRMILKREELFLFHLIELGKRVAVKCTWCDNIIEGRDGKVMSSKPSDKWEKFLICIECYAPIEKAMNGRHA
jgi:hypothetical protein